MRTTIKLLSAVCAGTALLACSSAGVAPAAGQLAPAPVPASSPALADGYYTLGRSQHAAGRYEDALQSYRQALQLDPRHVNARNGMAVLYAGQGDYGKAILLWQELVRESAGALTPESAFLLGNLGYAYLLAGDGGPAVSALEKACLLDPRNAMSWEHLAQALERQGQGERAALMLRQARSLQAHDLRRDYALLADESVAPATARALAARRGQGGGRDGEHDGKVQGPEQLQPSWPRSLARTEVMPAGGALVQLRRIAAPDARPAGAPAPSLPPSAPVAPALSALAANAGVAVRLEISNGNGVTGMAAALARTVRSDDVKVVRLTNMRPFAVPVSRIEYRADQQAAAQALAARLGMTATAPRPDNRRADVRIVLGRDLLSAAVLRQRYLK
ncbi:MAG TPA: LytR C-terminal domain-containing protein [Burkholderiaceae bacterium]|nr:LytR C-terminal domain-containing protein [Burkholderiaceae bacterium]